METAGSGAARGRTDDGEADGKNGGLRKRGGYTTKTGLVCGVTVECAIDRLAAYEDTGLEPDQIAETLWRLRDYFDADREGRLIVLPCEDRKGMENLANRIERMVVRDDYAVGVSGAEKRIAYAITSVLRSEE